MVAIREAVGDFPAVPAPDETWRNRSEWPAPRQLVELCWARRRNPSDAPRFDYGKGWLVKVEEAPHSAWANSRGEMLLFNPDFWRPLTATEQPDLMTAGEAEKTSLQGGDLDGGVRD